MVNREQYTHPVERICSMDPAIWGPYGWKMIHAVSRLPGLPLDSYQRWLSATAAILPCRKCRRNFRRHIRSGRCNHAKTPAELSICLHYEVSRDLGKTTAASRRQYVPEDLPPPTVTNILQPIFWLTVAMNKTQGKTSTLRRWFRETERVLSDAGNDDAAQALRELQMGSYAPILTHTQEAARSRHLTAAVRKMLKDAGIHRQMIPTQGKMSLILATTSGPRASTKRRHSERRSSRSGTRRRSRATPSRTSSE